MSCACRWCTTSTVTLSCCSRTQMRNQLVRKMVRRTAAPPPAAVMSKVGLLQLGSRHGAADVLTARGSGSSSGPLVCPGVYMAIHGLAADLQYQHRAELGCLLPVNMPISDIFCRSKTMISTPALLQAQGLKKH